MLRPFLKGCFAAVLTIAPAIAQQSVFGDGFEVSLKVDSITPRYAARGDTVTLRGSGFGSQTGVIEVAADRDPTRTYLQARVLSWGGDAKSSHGVIEFEMPVQLQDNGFVDIRIQADGQSSSIREELVSVRVPDDDVDPLRVVSAVSNSSTEILVQFSEPVTGGLQGAENPDHYRIAAPQAKAPTVGILSAEVVFPDLSTVRLTTIAQSDLTYNLAVANVRDLAGNPIAAPQLGVPSPATVAFVGTPPNTGELVDSDGDGLADSVEQRGWIATIVSPDGTTESRHVTSDPGNPNLPPDDEFNIAARDTDSDGVSDAEERHAAMDPRNEDTDGDTLTDNEEWNIIFSDPTHQDTDGDGVQDGFEFYSFRTSPVLADTDGDQLNDGEEITARNRNPRIADLPESRIRIGDVFLQIDERYTFQDTDGQTVTVDSSSSSTLTQETNQTYENSETRVLEVAAEVGFEVGARGDKNVRILQGGSKISGGFTWQSTESSSVASSRAFENSLRKGRELSTSSTVTREVVGARIDVDLTIENAGDLAFTIANIEVTALKRDLVSPDRFIPIATLVPNSTLITGEPARYNLGPFSPERGPFLFSSRDVFPNLVEELMKSPEGLVFTVANFDILDELGRGFTFSSQVARDRTGAITIDYGNGTVDRHLVATPLQFDADGISGGRFIGGFDGQSLPLGIPLDFALQDILGLSKNASINDGIVAGANQIAESRAQGDDIQVIPPGSTGLQIGSLVISAGNNGILDTPALGDDQEDVTTGYETSRTCSVESANAGSLCGADSECAEGSCTGPEALVRVGSQRDGDFNRQWFVLTTRELRAGADFGELILKPGQDIILAFVQDLDGDGLVAREEYLSGSTDSRSDVLDNGSFGPSFQAPMGAMPDGVPDSVDSDRDGIGDFAEVRLGWTVAANGDALRNVRSSPRRRDSDSDGLLDPIERDLRGFCDPMDRRVDGLCAFQLEPPVPQSDAIAIIAGANGRADTVAADDDEQLQPFGAPDLLYAAPVIGPGDNGVLDSTPGDDDRYEAASTLPAASDPTLIDTDDDGIADVDELTGIPIGISIRDGGDGFANTLAVGDDIQRAFPGTPVASNGIVVLPGPNGTIESEPDPFDSDDVVVSGQVRQTDPLRRDTDGDSFRDGIEIARGSDPTDPLDGESFSDSDQDGLTDLEEGTIGWNVYVDGAGPNAVLSNPSRADTDLDGLPDFIERNVRSNPNERDTDGDGLSDFDEFDDFEQYAGYTEIFPGLFFNSASSERYGTALNLSDTDGDGLGDRQELIDGYELLLPGEQSVRRIFTNPLKMDTDLDGLNDGDEVAYLTDATDPDTDDDGRLDGVEVATGSDPLRPDLAVELRIERIIVRDINAEGSEDRAEFGWWFTAQPPLGDPVSLGDARDGNLNSETFGGCDFFGGGPCLHQCQIVRLREGTTYSIDVRPAASQAVVLREGEIVRLNGLVAELDEVSADCGQPPRYIPTSARDSNGERCVTTFSETFSFEDLVAGDSILTSAFTRQDPRCNFEVQYRVDVR